MMRIFVAAEILRRQTGDYPQSASEIAEFFAGHAPEDPINNNAIELEIRDGRLIIACDSARPLAANEVSWEQYREENQPIGNMSLEELTRVIQDKIGPADDNGK